MPRLHDDDEDAIEIIEGCANSDVSGNDDKPIAILHIPDPEQRHGWREFYIWKQERKEKRKFGFVK